LAPCRGRRAWRPAKGEALAGCTADRELGRLALTLPRRLLDCDPIIQRRSESGEGSPRPMRVRHSLVRAGSIRRRFDDTSGLATAPCASPRSGSETRRPAGARRPPGPSRSSPVGLSAVWRSIARTWSAEPHGVLREGGWSLEGAGGRWPPASLNHFHSPCTCSRCSHMQPSRGRPYRLLREGQGRGFGFRPELRREAVCDGVSHVSERNRRLLDLRPARPPAARS